MAFWKRFRLTTSLRMTTKETPKKIDHSSMDEFVSKYDNFLVDCDGVLWHTDHISKFSGIREALIALIEKKKRLIFVSNNTMYSRKSFVNKIKAFCDIDIDKKDMFCANYAVAVYLRDIAKIEGKCYVIGVEGLKHELDEAGLANFGCGPDKDTISSHPDDLLKQNFQTNINAVVVGFDPHFDYNKLYKASSYLMNENCLYLATSTVEVSTIIGGDKRQPLTGSLVVAVTASTKKTPIVIGKPSKHLLNCILANNPDMDLQRTVMVGDSLKTDIAFARRAGIDSVLVLTGSSRMPMVEKFLASKEPESKDFVPNYYMDSFADFQFCLPL